MVDENNFDLTSSKHCLTIYEQIGIGVWGTVLKAELISPMDDVVSKRTVAVKQVRDGTTKAQMFTLRWELNILKNVRQHPNVVLLLGTSLVDLNLVLVLEYCNIGNLKQFLVRKSSRIDSGDQTSQENFSNLLTNDGLISLGKQIADGMGFVHSKRCVHRDLAARNILLNQQDDTIVAKVADFGSAKLLSEDETFTNVVAGKLPWPWYGLECLKRKIYLPASDVWSFGVVLWEIFSLGEQPYREAKSGNDFKIIEKLEEGYRLPKPILAGDDLYAIMLSCWNYKANDRPSFRDLSSHLSTIMLKLPNR